MLFANYIPVKQGGGTTTQLYADYKAPTLNIKTHAEEVVKMEKQ